MIFLNIIFYQFMFLFFYIEDLNFGLQLRKVQGENKLLYIFGLKLEQLYLGQGEQGVIEIIFLRESWLFLMLLFENSRDYRFLDV